MKKAIILLSSPRRNGNSEILAAKTMEGIKAAGGSCEVFYLNSMKIRPCQACYHCRKNSSGQCAIRDDMQLIYSRLEEADILLIASPIYMFTFSAQLKLFMDRCYACSHILAGKRIGIVLTYGEPDEYTSGAINAINTLKDEYRYTQSEIVGIVHGSADGKGEIASNVQLLEKAFALGKNLMGDQADSGKCETASQPFAAITTERLILRILAMQDKEEFYKYRSDPDVSRYQAWRPASMSEAEAFIGRNMKASADIPGSWLQLAVCSKETGMIMGDIGMHFLENDHSQVEIGYTLSPGYQGKGYATEAVQAVLHYLFTELKKHRVSASVDPHNRASIRLLERIGMRKEAHFIKSFQIDHQWHDDCVYAILEDEWNTIAGSVI